MPIRNEYDHAETSFIPNRFDIGNVWYSKFERPKVVNFVHESAIRISSKDYEKYITVRTKLLGK